MSTRTAHGVVDPVEDGRGPWPHAPVLLLHPHAPHAALEPFAREPFETYGPDAYREPYASYSVSYERPGVRVEAIELPVRARFVRDVGGEFDASELDWTGRRRIASFFAMLGSVSALASLVWVTGWQQQLGNASYLFSVLRSAVTSSGLVRGLLR